MLNYGIYGENRDEIYSNKTPNHVLATVTDKYVAILLGKKAKTVWKKESE